MKNKILITKCTHCGKHLTYKQKYNNKGICPYCGYKSLGDKCETHDSYVSHNDYDLQTFRELYKMLRNEHREE